MKSKEQKNLKQQKSLLIGLIAALIIILIAILVYLGYSLISKYQEGRKLMKDFREYTQKEELTIIYYRSSSCEYCELQTPILETIASDYNLDYLDVDYTLLSTKDNEEVLETLGIEQATPTTVIMKGGEVVALQKGYVDGYKLVQFFIQAGVLDEDATYKPEENLTFIDYETFEELKQSDTPVAVTMGTSVCQYCQSARPILSNVAIAYNVRIYYLTINYLSKDDRTSVFDELIEMGYDDEDFVTNQQLATPTIFAIQNGKVVASLSGLQNVTDYVKFLKEQNIITAEEA